MPDGVPRWIKCDKSRDGASEGIALPLIVVVAALVSCRIEVVSSCANGLDRYAFLMV